MKKNILEDQLHYESKLSKQEFLIVLQSMIDNDSLRTCSTKTFQLLHDIISGKQQLKKGRPRGLSTQGLWIWLAFSDEMTKPGMIRKQAKWNVANQFKVSDSTVEKVLQKMIRRKTKEVIAAP